MTKPNFEILDDPSEELLGSIREGIMTSLPKSLEPSNRKPFAIVLRNEDGDIVAGIAGRTWWQWLDINYLWVHPNLRGQDIGKKLMLKAEEMGRERNCTAAMVDTLDVQAKGFYEKLGYSVWGTQNDFPKGHKRYYLSKKL